MEAAQLKGATARGASQGMLPGAHALAARRAAAVSLQVRCGRCEPCLSTLVRQVLSYLQ